MDVCYIAGTGRSSSTLLERLLARMPGVVPIGAAIDLWWRGVLRNEPCGCGQVFHDCEFWSEVGDRAFDGWEPTRSLALHLTQQQFVQHAHPTWSTGLVPRRERAEGADLLDALARLYGTIADVSGARLLVDTSKRVSYAGLLDEAGIPLQVVNLVRDPRAVARSMAKIVGRPHVSDSNGNGSNGNGSRRTRLARSDAMEWVLFNEANRILTFKGIPVLRIRYEDLVARPGVTVHTILDHARYDGQPSDVDPAPSHEISGNPTRTTSCSPRATGALLAGRTAPHA